MKSLDSFHFHLTHQGGGTPLLAGIVMQEALGDVVSPDKLSIELEGEMGVIFIKTQVITAGDTTYMVNPLTGQWEALPLDVSPMGFFDPQGGIAAIMAQVTQVTLAGQGGDGERFYIIRGRAPTEALRPLFGAVAEGVTVDVELKIGVNSLRLLEAIVTGRVTPNEREGVVRTIRLSNFNEPVTIEPPQ